MRGGDAKYIVADDATAYRANQPQRFTGKNAEMIVVGDTLRGGYCIPYGAASRADRRAHDARQRRA